MLEVAREIRAEAAAGAAGAGMNTYNYFRRLLKEKGFLISPKMAAELYRQAVPGGFEAPMQEAGKEDEKDPEEEDNPEEVKKRKKMPKRTRRIQKNKTKDQTPRRTVTVKKVMEKRRAKQSSRS